MAEYSHRKLQFSDEVWSAFSVESLYPRLLLIFKYLLFYTVDIVYNDLEGSIFWKLQCAFLKKTMFPWWDT